MPQANIKAVITAEDRASSVISGFGGSVGKMASAVAIGQLAVQGLNSVMDKFAQAGRFAIESAGDFEQNRIAFETMLGSADKARAMLKEVSDFAAKTPFELPEVVTGAKQLLAYGIEAEKIIPTFKGLGNIAAGVGKDKLPQLILAFGQVKAATKLTGSELRQFTEAGVPLLDVLAKQSGKTAAQVKDDMERGIAPSFQDVEKALLSMSKEGGKFFNLMERQSTTFGGTMANLQDNFGRLAREIVGISDEGDIRQGGIFYYLSKGAASFLTTLDANKQGIIDFFQGAFTNAVNFAKEAWNKLQPSFSQLATTITTELMPALNRLWKEVLEPMMPVLKEVLINTVQASIGAMRILVQAISEVTNWFVTKWGEVAKFVQDHPEVQMGIEIIRGGLIALRDKVIEVFNKFRETVRAYGPEIKMIAIVIGAAIAASFGAAAASIYALLTAIGLLLDGMRRIRQEVKNAGPVAGVIFGPLAALGGIPGRAVGGPVSSNSPYMVGERGPELFVPNSSGRIVPNDKLSTGSGGGQTIINISPQVGVFAGSEQEMRKLSSHIVEALKDVANSKNMTVQEMMA